MRLSELMREVCAKTPLKIELPQDTEVPEPDMLMSLILRDIIGDAATAACLNAGMSVRGAYAFGEWLAELFSGWATRYSNEHDILYLNDVFGCAAFNDPHSVIRLYLLPSWDALEEYKEQVKEGIKAVYDAAANLR